MLGERDEDLVAVDERVAVRDGLRVGLDVTAELRLVV